jgi:hypothetical protein
MVAQPYFNEPGFEGMKGTRHGNAGARQYNARTRASTLKVAMLEHSVNPSEVFCDVSEYALRIPFKMSQNILDPGPLAPWINPLDGRPNRCNQVIEQHFLHKQRSILRQCDIWELLAKEDAEKVFSFRKYREAGASLAC